MKISICKEENVYAEKPGAFSPFHPKRMIETMMDTRVIDSLSAPPHEWIKVKDAGIDMYSFFLYSKDRWVDPVMKAFIETVSKPS